MRFKSQCVGLIMVMLCLQHGANADGEQVWSVDTAAEWKTLSARNENVVFEDGTVVPVGDQASYESVVHRFDQKRSLKTITFSQSPVWQNWKPVENIGPDNLRDAPVFLSMGPGNYWVFGRYGAFRPKKGAEQPPVVFKPEKATLDGFDIPLMTTPFTNQYDALGGLKPGLGGYHAWQSRDMRNWVHHGPVTEKFACWVTTAERVGDKVYIYYDYPNDQDPHLYIDDDLTDGIPGKNMGMAFKDPSDGSDCAVIRDLAGNFHLIYEDWTPINARKHSWDSPLAGHAVSPDGIGNFSILAPAVDERTTPTGKKGTYEHLHWKQHPDWDSNTAEYEIHEPTQNAFGDWAAICIGGQYYLFGDYHPVDGEMRVAWFTSDDINKPFTRCGEIGLGHPDPDIMFAEGQFYLITQMKTDYVSSGPWVDGVSARAGVDLDNDGKVDQWTEWETVSETYDTIEGFAKQVKRIPASIDLSGMPACYGVSFAFRIKSEADQSAKPIMDRVVVSCE